MEFLFHRHGTFVPWAWNVFSLVERKFPDVRPDQYDRMLFTHMKGSNDETTLFVQFLDVIEKTCRTGGLHGEAGRFSRYPPKCKTPVPVD